MTSSPPRIFSAALPLLVALLLALPAAHALQVRQGASRFDTLALPDPSLLVSPAPVPLSALQVPAPLRAGWSTFKTINGAAWDVYIDARSGAPLLVQGKGIPLIPGSGNTLQASKPVTLDSLAASLRGFMAQNASLLMANDKELVLNRDGSGLLTPFLYKVVFDRSVSGIPVSGDRFIFYVGHGNLVAYGAARWSEITTDPVPLITSIEARGALASYMGLRTTDAVEIYDRGTLVFVPMAAEGSALNAFDGVMGKGYRTALAWSVSLKVEGEPGTWLGLVDARSGAVLALYDAVEYAQVRGGVFPVAGDGLCPDGCEQPDYPMPWADITIGPSSATASEMGVFACAPGGATAKTTLTGPYVRVVDACGPISQSVSCDANLDLGTSGGTDCAVPAGASAGNTHAARSSYYHLNRIKEHARAWLPSNAWLGQQLTDRVNIDQTCNANYDPASGTVNFYRSGGGCSNSGEIAGVFLHEWAHGLDHHDGGGVDRPSEAYADVSTFLMTHSSCIGLGFTSSNCGGYGNACTSCTGVRDQDWDKRANQIPSTPEGFIATCSSSGSVGPCGKEIHCEGYLPGETLWDLANRDLPALGIDRQTAWQILDRLWYQSRTGSGGNAYDCGAPVSSRSCSAGSWYTQLRALDDEDGDLANGTPHAGAIFSAFNRHNIPCGLSTDATNQSRSTCPSLPAPELVILPGSQRNSLSWNAVPGAVAYTVLRNEQGCGWGFNVVATVTETVYVDPGLPDGFPFFYSVQAVGANPACMGPLSACTPVEAGGPHAAFAGSARVADSCVSGGGGDGDGIFDPGEQIGFSVTIRNDGNRDLTGVTATVTPVTAGILMVNGAAGFGDIAIGATGTTLAPHFTAHLPASLACGSTVLYSIAIQSNEGSWTSSFLQTVGDPASPGGTILSEGFSGGIPGTWTVVDGGSGGGAASTWTTANPCGEILRSPIASPAAIVDSDCAGEDVTQDEQLITPVLDLSSASSVTLDYDEYFKRWAGERGDVDVRSSLTGGDWINVVRNQGLSTIDPNHRTVDISAQAAGAADAQIRFRYYDASWAWYWVVDNVVVTWTGNPSCSMHACMAGARADVEVTVSGGPDPVATGEEITYNLTIMNLGPDPATNPQVTDATPAATTFRSVTAPAGWTCSAPPVGGRGTVTCGAASLAPGSQASVTLVVRADWCAGNGVHVPNTALVSSVTQDPNAAINSASLTTTVSDTGACDDGSVCTIADSCQAGVCVGGAGPNCEDGNPCTDDACNPASGCVHVDNTAPCDDADACTANDLCGGGVCAGAPVGPLPEVANQRFSSKLFHEWDPAVVVGGPSVVYDTVRWILGEWPVGSGPSGVCLVGGSPDTTSSDTEIPADGGGFYYLVRARSSCGAGNWGSASDGTARIPSACP